MKKKNVWRPRNTTFCARCQDSGQDVPYTSIKIADFLPFGFFVNTFQVSECSTYLIPLYFLILKLWQTYRCDYIKIEDGGSISSRAKEFFSPPNSPYQLCTHFLSPGTKRPVLKLTAHFCLMSKFRKRGPAPSFTHIPSCRVQGNVYLTSLFHNRTRIGIKWPNLN